MKHVIHIDNKPVVLVYGDFDEEIDVNDITRIDYSNIYGEAVTVSVILNKIGQLKAEAEKIYESKKLERYIYEADLAKRWRREANKTAGKFTITEESGEQISIKLTEKSIDSAIIADKIYQTKKNNEIKANRDLGYLDSLYWAIQSKDKKLNNLLPQVTPKDFYNEILDGKVNGILIKKMKHGKD